MAPKPSSSSGGFAYKRTASIAEDGAASKAQLQDRLRGMTDELRASAFWRLLRGHLASLPPFEDVVCLGVGNFSSHAGARYQLALAFLLREADFVEAARPAGVERVEAALSAIPDEPTPREPGPTGAGGHRPLLIFDPVMTPFEAEFARERGCEVPGTHSSAELRVAKSTLFFMPHCPRQLYANVVSANWGADALQRVALLGNSFEAYVQARARTSSVRSLRVPMVPAAPPSGRRRRRAALAPLTRVACAPTGAERQEARGGDLLVRPSQGCRARLRAQL